MTDPLGFCSSANAGESVNKGIVLILNSYHPGYAWTDNEQLGVIETFRERDINWQPHVAYMDMMRFPSGQHLRYFTEIIRAKYRDRKFSAVIAMDNAALEYVLDNQEDLFHKAPIVFCGINNYQPSMLRGHSNVTGIAENIDQTGTIEAMLKIHPEAREILVLHDYTVTGLASKKEMEDFIPQLSGRIRVRFIKNLPLTEILEELKNLKKDSLVLVKAFTTDRDGRVFGVEEITELFCRNSPVPVYGRQIDRLGYGIVGGKMLDGRAHGRNAARLALRVLAGEEAADTPVVTKSDARFMFDYKVMSRFGIPLSALPENSTVINKPISFYAAHRAVIQTAIGIICILIIIISLLIMIIIQRRRAEESLRESEERYRNVFENHTAVKLIIDPDTGSIIEANEAAVNYYGWSLEQRKQMKIQEINTLPPEDIKKAMEKVRTKKRTHFEFRHRRADGSIRDVEVFSSRIEVKGKHLLHSIIHDITDRKRAEEALHSSEQRLSDIIEFFPDATLVIDKEGKVIAWNRAIETMTGVKAEDMLGKGNYEYALPFYGERRPILIDLALHPQPERDDSYTHIRRMGDILFGEAYTPGLPGGKIHLSGTASVLRDAGGEIVAAIECIRDDTERRRAQEDVHQAEERYRSIFENAQEGIFRSTPEGRIILANQAMARILGYDSPEELMADVTDVARQLYVNPEERTKIRKMTEKQGPVGNYETQFYRKNGSIFWISLTMQVVRDEKGEILYYEGIMGDITDRKESAERMRKSLGATVQAIAVTVETRDPYTAGHQRGVANLARAIATEMNLPADQIDGIRMAAAIHDLGKIFVPAEILSKPTKLTATEFCLIKTHAQSGYDILKDIDFPWPIARMVLEHHERMNGSGYPHGLTGDNLLLESRILAVADVVESMATHRPYRPTLGINAALEEIEKNRKTLYDADVADACLKLFREKGYQLKNT
jgi:PAS domain S-box-containing protein